VSEAAGADTPKESVEGPVALAPLPPIPKRANANKGKTIGRQAGRDRATQRTSQRQQQRRAVKVASSARSRARKPNLVWTYRVLLADT
jgi:hypothetical protein